MIVIFSNSPFDDEIRCDCKMIKINTRTCGEVCILDNYFNSIFDVSDTCVEMTADNSKIEKIKIVGNGIVEVNNNTVHCFGQFERI